MPDTSVQEIMVKDFTISHLDFELRLYGYRIPKQDVVRYYYRSVVCVVLTNELYKAKKFGEKVV